MTSTTTATLAASVIPLQRNEARSTRRRHLADRTLPPATDTAWYDAEAAALFAGEHCEAAHGRRCACCRPATATHVAS